MIVSVVKTNYDIYAIIGGFIFLFCFFFMLTLAFYDVHGNPRRKWRIGRLRRNESTILAIAIILLLPFFIGIQLCRLLLILINKCRKHDQFDDDIDDTDYSDTIKPTDDVFSFTERQPHKEARHFYSTKSLMTDCEKEYYEAISSILKDQYTLQPQIPLSSIVNRDNNRGTPLELYRTIDFAILDEDKSIVCLIEINDRTHYQPARIERDRKVNAILEDAGIPLATIWTDKGMDKEYIKNQISSAIKKKI